jgi:hypothetical protein
VHWPWFGRMARRTVNELRGKCGCMNRYGRFNLIVNVLTGILFTVTALSGICLFFLPRGRVASGELLLLSKSTWDILHTWAGALLIATALVHFAIHWRWMVKVTHNTLGSLTARRATAPVVASGAGSYTFVSPLRGEQTLHSVAAQNASSTASA